MIDIRLATHHCPDRSCVRVVLASLVAPGLVLQDLRSEFNRVTPITALQQIAVYGRRGEQADTTFSAFVPIYVYLHLNKNRSFDLQARKEKQQ